MTVGADNPEKFPYDEDGRKVGLPCGNTILFAGTTVAHPDELRDCPPENPLSKNMKAASYFSVYRHRHKVMRTFLKASQNMVHVARLVVPVYRSTRVLKVSEQKDNTGDLNRNVRNFKSNVKELMALNKDSIDESFYEGLYLDISYCDRMRLHRPELYIEGFEKLAAKRPNKSNEPLILGDVFD